MTKAQLQAAWERQFAEQQRISDAKQKSIWEMVEERSQLVEQLRQANLKIKELEARDLAMTEGEGHKLAVDALRYLASDFGGVVRFFDSVNEAEKKIALAEKILLHFD